jgi:type II secretory pathway component GspD/PulD (secretin)
LANYPTNRLLRVAYPTPQYTSISPVGQGLFGLTNPTQTVYDASSAVTSYTTTPFTDTSRSALANLLTGTEATWAANAGLNLGFAFLNDLQAMLLVKAVQNSRKGAVISSPRVTVFNSQRANITVGRLMGYIADVDVGNIGSYRPEVATVMARGTTLDVRPIVTADRKYVYMELFPQTRELDSATPFRYIYIGFWTVADQVIELPQQDFKLIQTTVCVPDKGHLLIGGMADVTNTEAESGIPVLDKIPILKRLFSRHSTVKIRKHLLIMVHPTVLVHQELENKIY